jgi:hypothetical protein
MELYRLVSFVHDVQAAAACYFSVGNFRESLFLSIFVRAVQKLTYRLLNLDFASPKRTTLDMPLILPLTSHQPSIA